MIEDYLMELELRGQSKNTIRNYSYTISNFLEFTDKSPENINEQDIKRYMIYLKNQKNATNRTIHRHLNALRSFFRYQNIDIADKVQLPKLSKPLPKFLTREEIKILLEKTDRLRDKCLIRLLYSTGLRVSELVNLNKNDIKTESIHVISGKGAKDRIVFVDPGTQEMINHYISERNDDNEALFLSTHGDRISARTIQWLIKNYSKKAGIEKKVTPHVLRHSFATHMLEGDADIVVIKELLGHSNLATTQIYTHITDERRKKVYDKAHPLSKE
ncbi:MAG: tyrosine-type recombinase/integrase [Candidatus Methanofastidiosa archaeon]|nr:tyrosine-type recombinase/integrase [Candidatus Methanofastidiosa archaeon]HOM96077.1 tyrosine-type recombinase/integrase [Methanofastidiosum sp.]HPC81397.1 tyrosine-type recombinase/integrase [Methanofastidiosum sp.]HRS26437.1 tyrosine-type recombinase/integrase [Methanofastidiosum sp.]